MRVRTAGWCWFGLVGYVVVCDAYLIRKKQPTLSAVFGEILEHPVRRLPLTAVWIILTLHLFASALPDKTRVILSSLDPIARLARWLEFRLDSSAETR